MSGLRTLSKRPRHPLTQWLLKEERSSQRKHSQHAWWRVMCLTGVDYFSTLGYQPGIAALAAGTLAPFATLILILLTLFGALPIYRRVAAISSHGDGSIAMLEHLLPRWRGKLFVLCLLGFMATDFIITITLSAADATAHILKNPFVPHFLDGKQVGITLLLIALLGGVFLKGFKEAIGIAVVLVVTYLLLNGVVIGVGVAQVFNHPTVVNDWQTALFANYNNPFRMIVVAGLLFPKLALGLSGFETGVAIMPLVKGDQGDTEAQPTGRIRYTGKLLTTAAVIMSFFLLTSSFITTFLIPVAKLQPAGEANGRALAYLAHQYLGDGFGTIYDLSTISILWFAGASAMAGLLNVVPRYLPRYGMAPDWSRRIRPLVLVYTAIAFVITIFFNADVDAQGGAYATGVLVLMSSAAFAVTLVAYHQRSRQGVLAFGIITLLFFYTTILNIVERPEGMQIAACFIGFIILISLISRVYRSTELRVDQIEMDETADRFIEEAKHQEVIRLVAKRSHIGGESEYDLKAKEVREDHHISATAPLLFLEIQIADASDFVETVRVQGVQVGQHRILRAQGAAAPNAIAAILLNIRDRTGRLPHAYFGWIEGNPVQYLLRFMLLGEGDVAIVTREVLRKAVRDPESRPAIHVGG